MKPVKRVDYQVSCRRCGAAYTPRFSAALDSQRTCQGCLNEDNRLRRLIDRLQRTDNSPTKAATVRQQAAAAIKKLMSDRDGRKRRSHPIQAS